MFTCLSASFSAVWWKFIHRNKRLFSLSPSNEVLRFFLSSLCFGGVAQEFHCIVQHAQFLSIDTISDRDNFTVSLMQLREHGNATNRINNQKLCNLHRESLFTDSICCAFHLNFRQFSDSELCSGHWNRFLCIDVKRPSWLSQLSPDSACQVPFKAEATRSSFQFLQQFKSQFSSI